MATITALADVPRALTPKQCALTPQQEKMWGDTRFALVWSQPAFGHIFFSMLDNAGSKHVAFFTREVPIAATDGFNLLLNPDTFFTYNMNERIFICSHEIMHCIWNHMVLFYGFQRRGKINYPDGTSLPYDPMIMNFAADYVINDCLIKSKVGLFNKDWLHDPSLAVAEDSVIDAYRKVYKHKKGKGGGGGKGNKPGQGEGQDGKGSFDQHLPPGTSQGKEPTSAAAERNDVEWQTQIVEAINSAKAQGKLPAGLERMLGEVLEPKVDWTDKVTSWVSRKIGSGSYDWRKPDRRYIEHDIYVPSRSGHGAGVVVIGSDTSGSINDLEHAMFFGEMAGIFADIMPRRLVVMWCDAKVHRVDDLEEPGDLADLRAKKVPGGGGTDFRPVFDEIREMGLEPDALIYLTDGYGTFPSEEPPYPVLWGDITGNKEVNYPFGEVVNIPRQKQS
jgi:predicted metal-dependent peptidase